MRLLVGTKQTLKDVKDNPKFNDLLQHMQIIADEVNVKNVVEVHPEYEPEVRIVLETDSKYPYSWDECERTTHSI